MKLKSKAWLFLEYLLVLLALTGWPYFYLVVRALDLTISLVIGRAKLIKKR